MTKKDAPLLCFMKFGRAEKRKPTEKVNGRVEGQHADGWHDRGNDSRDGVRWRQMMCCAGSWEQLKEEDEQEAAVTILSMFTAAILILIFTH